MTYLSPHGQGDEAERPAPWGQRSWRLWSLWDMYPFKVDHLLRVSRSLVNAARSVKENDDQIDPGLRDFTSSKFSELLPLCQELNLPVSEAQITAFVKTLGLSSLSYRPSTVQRAAQQICATIETEISQRLFYVIRPEHAKYMSGAHDFGDVVIKSFPSALYDADEAVKCLALGRYTATVFHLMRVMEIGIRGLGRCVGVSEPLKDAERNWGFVQRGLKNKIDERSKGIPAPWRDAADKAFFENAYVSLDAVRNAWRNSTMHVESKYTEEDAENIYRSVRFFTRSLASRFDEQGEPKA